MQIVREIIVGFHWEEDRMPWEDPSKVTEPAMRVCKRIWRERVQKLSCIEAMTDEDDRFLSVDVDTYSKQCQSHWKMPRRLL